MRWFLSFFGLALQRDLEYVEEEYRASQQLLRNYRQDVVILEMRKADVETDLKELAKWVRICCTYEEGSEIGEIVNRSSGIPARGNK